MKAAYIDTSLIIALKFERLDSALVRAVGNYDLFASELLIAEVMAFGKRESIPEHLLWEAVKGLSWVIPEETIAGQLAQVIRCGYARGADLWHLACACYLSPSPEDLAFLTLDARQRTLASRLGFSAPRLEAK